jgi:hypothetical protein
LFRNKWGTSGNVFARARHQARGANIFIGLLCLGGKCFVVLARKDSDFAFTRTYLKIVSRSRSAINVG